MRPAGLEPATHSLEGCCSIHLSYGRVLLFNNLGNLARTATRLVTEELPGPEYACDSSRRPTRAAGAGPIAELLDVIDLVEPRENRL